MPHNDSAVAKGHPYIHDQNQWQYLTLAHSAKTHYTHHLLYVDSVVSQVFSQ